MFEVVCSDNYTMPSLLGPSFNGPPLGIMLSPPTLDPAASILNTVFGGLLLNETLLPRRVAFTKALLGPNQFRSPNYFCTVKKNSTSPYRLVNAQQQEVPFPIKVNFEQPKCTTDGAFALSSFVRSLVATSKNISSSDQVNQLSNLFDVTSARESFSGCSSFIGSFLTFKNASIQISNSRECPYRYEDRQWALSPCCNPDLAQFQCCVPETRTKNIRVIDTINYPVLGTRCRTPSKIGARMLHFSRW